MICAMGVRHRADGDEVVAAGVEQRTIVAVHARHRELARDLGRARRVAVADGRDLDALERGQDLGVQAALESAAHDPDAQRFSHGANATTAVEAVQHVRCFSDYPGSSLAARPVATQQEDSIVSAVELDRALADLGVTSDTLSDDARDSLDRNGYAIFPSLMSPEAVAEVRAAIIELEEREDAAGAGTNPRDPGAIRVDDVNHKGAVFDQLWQHPCCSPAWRTTSATSGSRR